MNELDVHPHDRKKHCFDVRSGVYADSFYFYIFLFIAAFIYYSRLKSDSRRELLLLLLLLQAEIYSKNTEHLMPTN